MSRYDPEYLNEMKREPMTLNFIKHAIEDKSILEALVTSCDVDYTLTLDLGKGIIGKIPFEELEYNRTNTPTKSVAAVSKVGKRVKFIPTNICKNDNGYVVECSRKESQKECFENYISKLSVGDIIPARAVRAESYGAFCDIGCGIIALLPTSCVSITHIINPKETFKHLRKLYVVIRSIDENFRIQLTHKELLGTWEEEASKFSEGDVVIGKILSKETYGYFVKLSQNLSGLAELVDDMQIELGDKVSIRINAILKSRMKIKLSILENLGKDDEPLKFEYTQISGHIDSWKYSISGSGKVVETTFPKAF